MKVGIVGCGNMGQAFAKILSPAHALFLYDHHPEKAQNLAAKGFGNPIPTLDSCIRETDLLIIAIKPQSFSKFTTQIPSGNESKIVLSLLTGISLEKLRKVFPSSHLLRLMPNLAIAYGAGIVGLCAEEQLPAAIKQEMEQLLAPLGLLFWMPESKMDAFTSLAGSGPGFTFPLIEAMIEAGILMGFNAKDSQALVEQMLLGTLTVLKQTGKHPAELKWQVTSPGGTTIAGLKEMENSALKGKLMNVFWAAYQRAKELA